MKRLIGIGAAVAALLFSAAAFAQCTGSPAANSICAGVAAGNPGPVKLRQLVLPDLPPIPNGTVIGNVSGTSPSRPAALSSADLGGLIGLFSAANPGLVPAPGSAVPTGLAAFYSVNADAVWRPKTGETQTVTSGTLQVAADAGLVIADNTSGSPISLALPALSAVEPGWTIRVGVRTADASDTVVIAASGSDDIRFEGQSINPAQLTSPRLVQVTAVAAIGSDPAYWSFSNFGPPTALFAGFAPAMNGGAGTYLDSNYQWTTPGGGGGSPTMPDIPTNTVLGNVSGSTAQPAALSQQQLQSVIGTFGAALPGLVPASGVATPATDVLTPGGFAEPQVVTAAPVTGNGTAGSPIAMPPGMPRVQRFLATGAAVYQKSSAAVQWIEVEMKGGGGGGQGGSSAAAAGITGAPGAPTGFADWLVSGGTPGGGSGGTGTADGTGFLVNRTPGSTPDTGAVWSSLVGNLTINGRSGAGPGAGLGGGGNGVAAKANSGGGGAGGGPGASGFTGISGYCGSGGGEADTVKFIMTAAQIAGPIALTVGAGGQGGFAANSTQTSGGDGGSGFVIVQEYDTPAQPVP